MKKIRNNSGQSLIEFALIFPAAFFLIMGFLDMGRAIFYYSSLNNAVREATRYSIVNKDDLVAAYNNPSDNSLQDKVIEFAFGLTGIPDSVEKSDISVTPEMFDGEFTTVSIQAVYLFQPITPGIKAIFGTSEGIELTVQSKMYVTPGAQ